MLMMILVILRILLMAMLIMAHEWLKSNAVNLNPILSKGLNEILSFTKCDVAGNHGIHVREPFLMVSINHQSLSTLLTLLYFRTSILSIFAFCLQNVHFLAILGSWSDQLWRKGFVRRSAFLTFIQIFIPLKITFIQQYSFSKEKFGENGGGFVAKFIIFVFLLHPF